MVCAVVPEGQLVGLATQGEPEELVAEADPERRDLTEQRTQSLYRGSQGGRVAGAVGEEEAIRFGGEDLLGSGGARHREDRGPAATELAAERTLYPVVNGDDAAPFLS